MTLESRAADGGTHIERRSMKLSVKNQRVDDNVASHLYGSTGSCASHANAYNSVGSKLALVTRLVNLARKNVNVREIFANIELADMIAGPRISLTICTAFGTP